VKLPSEFRPVPDKGNHSSAVEMKVLVGLLCIVAGAQAFGFNRAKVCSSPPSWETKAVETVFTSKTNVKAYMKVSYDEVEKRVRIVEDIKYGSKPGQRKFFDIILLYKERAMYIVQIKLEGKGKVTRTCTKHRLRKPFKKAAVPKDAIFYQQQYMGTGAEPGAGLLLNVYGGKTKCKKGSYVMTVTKNLCLPVYKQITIPGKGEMQLGFYDVTLGLDPSVFGVPKECQKLEHEPLSAEKTESLPGKSFWLH